MKAPEAGLMERVDRATTVLRSMLPTLSAYASAMIGRQIAVSVGPQTQTTTSQIWVRPPLELADLGPHIARYCGRRDEKGVLTCPTCRGIESVLVRLRHEISHHVYGSFAERRFRVPGREVYGDLEDALVHVPIGARPLVMVLEDMRIDRLACDDDPHGAATHYTFHAQIAVGGGDSGHPPISEGDLPARVTFGLLSYMVGSDVAEMIGDDAVEILHDARVIDLVGGDFEAEDVPLLAAQLYDRLVELGVFDAEPEPPKAESDDPGDNDNGDGDNGDNGNGDDDNGGDSGDHDSHEDEPGTAEDSDHADGAGQPESGDGDGSGQPGSDQAPEPSADSAEPGGRGPDDGADPTTGDGVSGGEVTSASAPEPAKAAERLSAGASRVYGEEHDPHEHNRQDEKIAEAVTALLEHVAVLGEVSAKVGAINVYTDGDGRLMKSSARVSRVDDMTLGGLVGKARRVFSDNAAVKRTKGTPRGRVEPTLLGRRAWNPEDPRVFGSRIRPNAPSYTLLIGMDNSYSTKMLGVVDLIRSCVDAMAGLCSRTGVDFSVYAHTTSPYYKPNQPMDMEIYQLKSVYEPWTPRVRDRLGRLSPGETNLDGSTLRLYRRRLLSQPATRRILLYFTDGEIPGSGGAAEAEIMRSEVGACRRDGVTLLGVGIRTSSPEKFGIPTVRLDGPSDIAGVLAFLAHEFGV